MSTALPVILNGTRRAELKDLAGNERSRFRCASLNMTETREYSTPYSTATLQLVSRPDCAVRTTM